MLFKPEHILPIIEDRKTQTRREYREGEHLDSYWGGKVRAWKIDFKRLKVSEST